MSKKSEFFSATWINEVFSSPPARQVKGRTRWTHRHGTWINHLNRFVFVESRNELVSLLALDYLKNNLLIRRFKEQPFTLSVADIGFEYTPDFAFEDNDGALYVVEIKTHRFVTRQVEEKLEEIKEFFLNHKIRFLLWTDKSPLTNELRHNILNMRRFSFEHFLPQEKENLSCFLREEKEVTVGQLFDQDVDLGLIYASLYSGHAHADIRQKITTCSRITSESRISLISIFAGACATDDAWWNALEVA